MNLPEINIPITKITLKKNIHLWVKREDLVHLEISGNKYWKLFYNINRYLQNIPLEPRIITFGGAYSNHIAAVAALARDLKIPALGIIRGEELADKFINNPTLKNAYKNGMDFRFVTRTEYRNKNLIEDFLKSEYPEALIIPEGGTNKAAVEGVKFMLNEETKQFNYLCSAVGTGGTLAGISKYAEEHQKVLGFSVVNDISLSDRVLMLSEKDNFEIIEAHQGGYGKITDETVEFINTFHGEYHIPLDPVYTGKMMRKLLQLADQGFFPEGSSILAFHTGGLQGNEGANDLLRKQNRNLIKI